MDADKTAAQRVNIMFDSIINQFPDLDVMQLKFAISDGFTSLALKGINEDTTEKSIFNVEYWFNTRDGYDFNVVEVEASSPEEAIEIAKTSGGNDSFSGKFVRTPNGSKDFKITTDA